MPRETFFGAATTVTVQVPTFFLPDITVIFAVPFFLAVMTPFLLTVATEVLELLKVAFLTLSVYVSLTPRVIFLGNAFSLTPSSSPESSEVGASVENTSPPSISGDSMDNSNPSASSGKTSIDGRTISSTSWLSIATSTPPSSATPVKDNSRTRASTNEICFRNNRFIFLPPRKLR